MDTRVPTAAPFPLPVQGLLQLPTEGTCCHLSLPKGSLSGHEQARPQASRAPCTPGTPQPLTFPHCRPRFQMRCFHR